MNNDDNLNTSSNPPEASATSNGTNANGTNANGTNANGTNANGTNANGFHGGGENGVETDVEAAHNPAMRDALEDAHALFVRPAQGAGVARGMNSSENVSLSMSNGDYDPNDAYHRAIETSDENTPRPTSFAPTEKFAPDQNLAALAPAGHSDEHFATDLLPSSVDVPAVALSIGGGSGGGLVPPSSVPPSAPLPVPPHDEEHEQDIWEHLGELRSRILKCVAAVAIAMVVTWQFRDAILAGFASPIIKVLHKHGGILTTVAPMDGFSMYLQTTFTAALLLVLPFVLWQVWAFIEPALTHKERRFSGILVPFSVLLFFVGAAFGFYLTPVFFDWFFQFQPPGTSAFWTYSESTTFLAKMLLVFGVCFQVPVLTIFVNKIGLVSRNLLIEYWRHVVVVIFIVVAVITPSWDPFTMTAAALPPCILYGVSIWLVKWL